jgi:putative methionine-R-sulfoxide reductase with GAF domain
MPDSDRNMIAAPSLLNEIDRVVAIPGTLEDHLDQVVALLFDRVGSYTWVGVYLMDGNELALGPFRGKPSPHTRIPLNKGICGAAASQKQTVIVPDVNADPRFLACSLETRSEIVVPIMDGQTCLGEIDIDSDEPDAFDDIDRLFLEAVALRLAHLLAPR